MRIFLAGIMQGSHLGELLHNQEYRARLRALLTEHLPEAEVYDPLADHPQSLLYDDPLAREVFFRHNRMCSEYDVVLAFLPEASMGTAIEMWEAHRHGRAVVTISPLRHNWVVRCLSDAVYPDLAAFEEALAAGKILRTIEESRASRQAPSPPSDPPLAP